MSYESKNVHHKIILYAHSCRECRTIAFFSLFILQANDRNAPLCVFSSRCPFIENVHTAHRRNAFPVVTSKSQVNYSTFFLVSALFSMGADIRRGDTEIKSTWEAKKMQPNSFVYYLRMLFMKTMHEICFNSITCHTV